MEHQAASFIKCLRKVLHGGTRALPPSLAAKLHLHLFTSVMETLVPGALCGGSTAPWLLGHAALGAIAWQHLFRMSDEVFPNSTGIVLALGSGIATTLIYVQRLNKALHSSLEMIRFPSAPRFYQICN